MSYLDLIIFFSVLLDCVMVNLNIADIHVSLRPCIISFVVHVSFTVFLHIVCLYSLHIYRVLRTQLIGNLLRWLILLRLFRLSPKVRDLRLLWPTIRRSSFLFLSISWRLLSFNRNLAFLRFEFLFWFFLFRRLVFRRHRIEYSGWFCLVFLIIS